MKVLLVEDESIVADHLAAILEEIGYEVSATAPSASEAMDAIRRCPPDLALIDVMLEGNQDGISLASAIRASHDIPILFVTSFSDRVTVERAKATNPDGYVLKPFSPDDVYVATEMALMRYTDRQGAGGAEPAGQTAAAGEAAGSPENGGAVAFQVRRVQRHIEAHIEERLTLGSLAEVAGMSKYYFSRLFRESVGLPPYQYILKRRVDLGRRLLHETDLPIARVALRVGFSNQSHFGEAFRRLTGCSPTEFRKQCGGQPR